MKSLKIQKGVHHGEIDTEGRLGIEDQQIQKFNERGRLRTKDCWQRSTTYTKGTYAVQLLAQQRTYIRTLHQLSSPRAFS